MPRVSAAAPAPAQAQVAAQRNDANVIPKTKLHNGLAVTCVQRPSLADGTHGSSKNYVSKIVNKDNKKERVKHHESLALKVIDPDQRLFVYPLTERAVETTTGISRMQCNKLLKTKTLEQIKEHYVNVVVPFSGSTLHDFLNQLLQKHRLVQSMTSSDVIKLFYGLKNVFDGARTLRRNNICHRDIKADNIATLPRFRLASFGLAVKVDGNLVQKKHRQYVNTVYEHWPLDYQVAVWYCNSVVQRRPDDYKQQQQQQKHWLSALVPSDVVQFENQLAKQLLWFKTSISQRANFVLSSTAAESTRDFRNRLLASKSPTLANAAVEKLDVYSLGIVVLNVAHVVQSCGRYSEFLRSIVKRFENLGLYMTRGSALSRPSIEHCWFSYMAILQDLLDDLELKKRYASAAQQHVQHSTSK